MRPAQFVTRQLVILLATLCLVASAHAQNGIIDCSHGGHGTGCQVQLRAGQKAATIRFRPSPAVLGKAQILYRIGRVNGVGLAEGINTDTVRTDAQQIATLHWTGTPPTTDTTRILVQLADAVFPQYDTIYLLPVRPAADRVAVPNYSPYVWLRDNWMPLTIRTEIRPVQGPMTEERCERVRFTFQPRAGGTAAPDTGNAQWEPDQRDTGGLCIAETRWKLGDATGPQQLRIVVGDGERVARSERILQANAREGPRIVAGVAGFTRFTTQKDFYCLDKAETRDQCEEARTETDTLKREFPVERKNAAEPFFGVESPLFFSNQPGNPITRFIYKRVRVVVGSTFEEPKENLFVGLTAIPLAVPAYERVPVQIQAAWRPREGGFLVGGSVDGSALISSALKALGATL